MTLNLAHCLDKLHCFISEAERSSDLELPETIESRRQDLERTAVECLKEIKAIKE